jgi:hypothetical protein
MSWEEAVNLLERELARAHASLRLEEHRNRGLSQLSVAASPGSTGVGPMPRSRATWRF